MTLLVSIVAVFLSYNANAGLPFVPTYDLKAELPNSAEPREGQRGPDRRRARGPDRRDRPRCPSETGEPTALLGPQARQARSSRVPVDSTLIVRPRSALGLKYVELTPGPSKAGFDAGSTIPLKQATPEPVEIDELFNTFDADTRRGAQRVAQRLRHRLRRSRARPQRGDRGVQPAAGAPRAGGEQPRRPAHPPEPALPRAGRHGLRGRAGGRGAGRAVRRTWTPPSPRSPASRGRSSRTSSPRARPRWTPAIAEFPKQRPFLRNTAAFFRELRPGVGRAARGRAVRWPTRSRSAPARCPRRRR